MVTRLPDKSDSDDYDEDGEREAFDGERTSTFALELTAEQLRAKGLSLPHYRWDGRSICILSRSACLCEGYIFLFLKLLVV